MLMVAVTVVLATSALALVAMWIGGGRQAVLAQRRRFVALVGVLTAVALAVAIAAESDARLTAFVVGLVSLVVSGWFVVSRSGFPRVLAVSAAAATLVVLAVLILGR
ncbi:MAG: hypothetical protein WEE67_04045 [Chloroflexota bacterium]